MAIPWADPGGEYYFSLGSAGAVAAGLWGAVGTLSNAAPAGRATTYGINVNAGSGLASKNLGANYTSFILGIAFYIQSNLFTNGLLVVAFVDNATVQVDLRTDAAGHLFFTRNGTTIGSVSTQALTTGWHYFEIKVTINSSTGFAEVRVDGTTWVTVSGANTQATANAFMQTVKFAGATGGFMKDIVFIDTTSGVRTSYLGDVTVGVFFANGAGANTAWTPNGAGSNYQCVQDGITHSGTWPDGDTTYVASSTVGQQDDYAHQSVSITGSILAVIHASYLRKDDAGSRSVEQYIKSGSTLAFTSDIFLGNSYLYYFQTAEQDPNTSADWTQAGFNGMTAGCKVTS